MFGARTFSFAFPTTSMQSPPGLGKGGVPQPIFPATESACRFIRNPNRATKCRRSGLLVVLDMLEKVETISTMFKPGLLGPSLSLMVLCCYATENAVGSTLPAEVPINQEAGRGGGLVVTVRLESGEELPFWVDTGTRAPFSTNPWSQNWESPSAQHCFKVGASKGQTTSMRRQRSI